MDKKIIFGILLISLVLVFGCTSAKELPVDESESDQTIENGQNGASVIMPSEKIETVKIQYFAFVPSIIYVEKGTTVVWENLDKNVIHNIASGKVENYKGVHNGLFESGDFKTGESWNYTFNEEGEYTYHNPKRIQMQGLIVVGEPKNETIQIMTPHFVGSIPTHNKKITSLSQLWITFNVVISDGSEVTVYDIVNKKPVELVEDGIETSNYLRLKTKFAEPLEPSLYKVSYVENRPEGMYLGQFYFMVED